VQSHRGLIERRLQTLKRHRVLQDSKADSIETKEKELDVVMSISNGNLAATENRLPDHTGRPPHAEGAHIITPNLDVPRRHPKKAPNELPQNVLDFQEAFHAVANDLKRTMERSHVHQKFSGRVVKRGENLWKGGNVLQIQVQNVELDLWWVKMHVAPSLRAGSYQCILKFTKNSHAFESMCDCTNG
jgi:hypothetical protein